MFVVVLGTVASASTWAFNVVRALVALGDPDAISFFADRGEDVLANLPPEHGTVILKAHALDGAMVRLLNATGARIIFTDRDPADSAASQQARFGIPLARTAQSIGQTYVSVAMLRPPAAILALRYEDNFPNDPATLQKIAGFLDLHVPEADAEAIFAAHQPQALKSRIATWVETNAFASDPRSAERTLDSATQWHPGHLGDGEIGKAARLLSAEDRALFASVCVRWFAMESWDGHTITWPSPVFNYHEPPPETEVARLAFTPVEQAMVWGPYGTIPPGRWRARPLIEGGDGAAIFFRLDAFISGPGRSNTLAMKLCSAPSVRPGDISIEFNHMDHADLVEVRLYSVAESDATVSFRGVELSYLGPLDHPAPLRWRRASEVLGGPVARALPVGPA